MRIRSTDKIPYYTVFQFFLLLWLAGFFIYGINKPITNAVYFSFIFLLFLRSNNKVFWIALFFIMIARPWGLFAYRWNSWIVFLTPTVGVPWYSLLPFILILKFIIIERRKKIAINNNILNKYYRYIGFYIVFMIVWGLIWGYSITHSVALLKVLSSFVLFATLPRLFTYKQLTRISAIIFLFSIFLTLTSFIDIITGGGFRDLIAFGSEKLAGTVEGEDLTRQTGGIYLSLYSMIMGLYYLVNKRTIFNIKYLWLVIFFSWLYIINSATRGWMLASIFLMLSFFIIYYVHGIKRQGAISTLIIIFLVGYFLLPSKVLTNINYAFDRFATLEHVVEGDMTAGGTAGRWDIRGPRVMSRFSESPVFGFGYSKVTFQYADGHVANHTLLLSGGVVGFAILYFTLFALIVYFFKLSFKGIFPGLAVFALGLISIIMIQTTTRNMITYMMSIDNAFFLCILFNYINALAFESKKNFTETLNEKAV